MLQIKTKKFIDATIEAPASKSYTQRSFIVAALADGKSIIQNPLFCDDTSYMISALKNFGVNIYKKGKDVIVHGTNGDINKKKRGIFVGDAGTSMRFITTFAALCKGESIITGTKRMHERPIKDLLEALKQLGIKSDSNNGYPPVRIYGGEYGGEFNGGSIDIKGNVSSQYLSSILMCAPYAKNDVSITINGNLNSKPYVDITLDVMKQFGVVVKNIDYKKFIVKNIKKYNSNTYRIEGDLSSASYFFAAAAVTKGKVKVTNINPKSKQGDLKFVSLLKNMGCNVIKGNDFIKIEAPVDRSIKSIEVDASDMPDTVPTLAVTSLFADSKTTISNVSNLRFKESDRLKAIATELRKIGANVEEIQDGLIIKRRRIKKAVIETYNDHRIAMSFAVAGLVINGIKIKNPSCVKKSFPDFWDKFNQLYN